MNGSGGSNDLGTLSVGIALDTAGLVAGLSGARNLLGGFAGMAATALGGMGVASIKAAADFQTSMTQLVTGAGESEKNIKAVSDGILNLATSTGTSTSDLSAGMYMIESAGYHGATGLSVLQAAAEGAKVGAASLADVANGVTTEMTDYASSHITAAQATNTLIAAVSEGKTHLSDLSTAMATVLPTSAAVHVSLGDVAGAMATMTGEGTNASAAATYLRQLLMALEAPASKGAKALQDIGLTTGQVSTEMQQSLPGALQMIMTHLAETYTVGSPQYVEALKNIAGGSRQMQGILELTGQHLQVFQQNVLGIADAVNKGGNSITGWSLVQQDFNQKLEQAKEVVETLGIKLGTELLPVVGKLFDAITPLVSEVGNDLTGAFGKIDPLVTQIGQAFNDVFVPVQKVTGTFTTLYTTVGPPLLDTFNRATAILKETSKAAAPLTDTFDRATIILKGTGQAFTPLLDTFDRASGVLEETGQTAAPLLDTFDRATALIPQTTQAVNPFLSVMQDLKPVVADIGGIFETTVQVVEGDVIPAIEGLAGKVEPIITDFVTWDEKTHFIQNSISDVGGFIKTVAGDIGNDLVPPVRSLISNFEQWLTKSNFVHDSLQLLGGVVNTVSGLIGTLVGWVSDVFGWFGKSQGAADLLKGAIFAIGGVIAGVKIFQFGQDIFNTVQGAIGNFKDLASNITSFVGNAISKVSGLFTGKGGLSDSASQASSDAQKSLDGISTKASDVEGKVKTSSENMKTDLSSNVGTGASDAEGDIGGIATKANDVEGTVKTEAETMSTDLSTNIATGASAAETDIGGIAVEADTVQSEVGLAAAAMGLALGGVLTVIQGIANWSQELGSGDPKQVAQAVKTMTPGGDIASNIAAWIVAHLGLGGGGGGSPSMPPGTRVPGFAAGGIDLPAGQAYVAGEAGPELIYPSGVTNVANAAQTASLFSGGGSGSQYHFHLEMNGREIGYAIASDAEAADVVGNAIIRRTRLRTGSRV